MNRTNSLKIIAGVLILGVLMTVVAFIGKKQDLRRGAYFAATKLYLQPDSLSTSTLGDIKTVAVFLDTGLINGSTTDKAKPDFAKVRVCYGPELTLAYDTPTNVIMVPSESPALETIMPKTITIDETTDTNHRCAVFSAQSGKSSSDLQSGTIEVALLKFKVVGYGSGTIDFDQTVCKVSGDNPDLTSNDMSILIDQYIPASYVFAGVTPGETVSPTQTPENTPTPTETLIPTQTPDNTPVPTQTLIPTQTPENTPTPTETLAPTLTPTGTLSPTPPYLAIKFKMTYSGLIDAQDSMCSDNWKIKLLVMGGGKTAVYTDVQPVREVGTTIYDVGTTLSGWTVDSGVALFIKGPGHLQMKEAVDGQTGLYGQAGGQLTLSTTLDANTPVFNFVGNPLLGGDVVSDDGSTVPDGRIDAVDFAAVKDATADRSIVGVENRDLDGSCQMASNDVEVLKNSLKVKQSEMY